MKESEMVKEWQAEAKAEMLVQILQVRFKSVPDDLRTKVLGEKDPQRVTELTDTALTTRTLQSFRRKTGL
jgi:hypothetical protein